MTRASELLLDHVRDLRDEMVDFLVRLARAESPTDEPVSQVAVQRLLRHALESHRYRVRRVAGSAFGGVLLARPLRRRKGSPFQLLLGHGDTVWATGTLERMPVRVEEGHLHGPGTFDMKAGLTQIVFALRALSELGLEPAVTPVVLVNSDEEVGSPESRRWIARLARSACRALVLEPSLGPEGRLKTARKGVGRYRFTLRGRSAHAGLDPDGGASAILELGHLVRRLEELHDPEAGVTVNVGVVEGGTRANVVAALARAEVDVRVPTRADGERVDRALRALEPVVRGVSIELDGGMEIPPMERTPRNRILWEAARVAGREMGLDLQEASAGGASDGNTASRHTATLDGLGAVGDGAHARHEHVVVDAWIERCALLARLLLMPADVSEGPGELAHAGDAGRGGRGRG